VVVVVVVVVWIRARLFRWVELPAPQAPSELWSQEEKMVDVSAPLIPFASSLWGMCNRKRKRDPKCFLSLCFKAVLLVTGSEVNLGSEASVKV
jgi:hypothetical protein